MNKTNCVSSINVVKYKIKREDLVNFILCKSNSDANMDCKKGEMLSVKH